MAEELRDFRAVAGPELARSDTRPSSANARLEDEALSVAHLVRTERLYHLRHVEERDRDGMVLEYSQCVLEQDGVTAELGEQEPESVWHRDRSPVEEVLRGKPRCQYRVWTS